LRQSGEDRIDLLGGNHAFELGVQGVRRALHGDLHRGVELLDTPESSNLGRAP
jgi:hypothetical protein